MIIYTQGSFDIIHSGHMNLLDKCRRLAGESGRVYVGLITDEAYLAYRGYQIAKPYRERESVLRGFRDVDVVVPCDNTKTREQIVEINPDIIVVGSDWVAKDIYSQYRMTPDEINHLLVFHPYTQGITSTQIKERIKHDVR